MRHEAALSSCTLTLNLTLPLTPNTQLTQTLTLTSFLALGPTLLRGLHKDFLKFVTKTPFQGLPQVPHQDITSCVRQTNKQEW